MPPYQPSMEITLPLSFLNSLSSMHDSVSNNNVVNNNRSLLTDTTTNNYTLHDSKETIYSVQLNGNSCLIKTNCFRESNGKDDYVSIRFPIVQNTVNKRKHFGKRNYQYFFTDIRAISTEDYLVLKASQDEAEISRKVVDKKKCNRKSIVPEVNGNEFLPEDSTKRYSLRGVKIPARIMKVEKSSEDEEFNVDSDTDEKKFDPCVDMTVEHKAEGHISDSNNDTNVVSKEMGRQEECVHASFECPAASESNNEKRESDIRKTQHLLTTIRKQQKNFGEYVCFICVNKLLFKTKAELKVHEKENHNDLKCPYCVNSKQYKHLSSLRSHCLLLHSSISKLQSHMCHICPARFKYASTLKQHIDGIHKKSLKVTCEQCGKDFQQKSQLKRHQKIHGDSNSKLMCDVCGKGFWHKSNLFRHCKLVHSSHRESFHCSYCGKGFTQKSGMISHIKSLHFQLQNFKCSMCSTIFARSRDFENHMRINHHQEDYKVHELRPTRYKYHRTNDDMIPCKSCSKTFLYKAEFIEHMYSFHADSFPVKCDDCNQGFLRRPYLNRHRKVVHKAILTAEEESELTLANSTNEIDTIVSMASDEQAHTNLEQPPDYMMNLKNDKPLASIKDTDDSHVIALSSGTHINIQPLETTPDNAMDNVAFITNFDYGSTEEVVTSDVLDTEAQVLNVNSQLSTDEVLIVQDDGNNVQYVIHPSIENAEELKNLLFVAN